MGRLFWKFFFFFWLAQFATSIGVGVTIWFKSHDPEHNRIEISANPPPMLSTAIATLRQDGVASLRSLLAERKMGPPIFAVDENNHELLGRDYPPWAIGHADREAERVTADDGHRYLLFVPPPPRREPDEHHRPPPERRLLPLIIPLVAGGLVSLCFAALLARYFSKPIRILRSAFESAADGCLDERVEPKMGKRRDELADLGRDFDSMAQHLKSLMDGQRRLLHDVSHELRSPLARLQAAIGLARQQPERLDDTLARIERESVRMDTLVSELLTLSRLEAGMAGKLDEDVDLNELLANVVDDARFEAEASGCRVEFEARGAAVVRGNAELLHRAVENVVRNALKHSPKSAWVGIELRVNSAEQTVCLAVSDQGPGVPETELRAIFEPFFRGNQACTPDGHGLGLAISHRVVTAHRGKIFASNRSEGGLCVTICLPAKSF